MKDIADLFKENGFQSLIYLGNNASEEKLKTSARNFGCLHIATHGIINNTHPWLSGLAFNNSNKLIEQVKKPDWELEQNTDGVLYAKEIYNLDLNAQLVVLSACETGIGKFSKGEGVLSLTRGFLYSKVPNILFTLGK